MTSFFSFFFLVDYLFNCLKKTVCIALMPRGLNTDNFMLHGVQQRVPTVVKVASQLLIPLASGDIITDQPAHPRLQGENFSISQLFSSLML